MTHFPNVAGDGAAGIPHKLYLLFHSSSGAPGRGSRALRKLLTASTRELWQPLRMSATPFMLAFSVTHK
jgi:hypothetical protein